MHSIESKCAISELSDESLKFAFENAQKKDLELYFIQLLEAEIENRNLKNSKKITI